MNTAVPTAEVVLLWAEAIVRDEWRAARAEYAEWRREVGAPEPIPGYTGEETAAAWFAEVGA